MGPETRNITQEEWLVISEGLQDFCDKHNIVMGIKSQIEILKRVEEPTPENIPSPYESGATTTETAEEVN